MTVPEMFPRLLSVMTNPSFLNGEAAGADASDLVRDQIF